MGKLYEEQEDGSLKPVEIPERLAKRVHVYLQLRNRGLELEEISWLTLGNPTELEE